MPKNRRVNTGLKFGKTQIWVGDVLKFSIQKDTKEQFLKHPIAKVLIETGYPSIVVKVGKHDWLELNLTTFVLGNNETLAERGLVLHLADGKDKDDFDFEYETIAPSIYFENLMDTTFLRFLLDSKLHVEKICNFDKILKKSEDFYINAAREIHIINEQKSLDAPELAAIEGAKEGSNGKSG